MKTTRNTLSAFSMIALFAISARAETPQEFLRAFHANPSRMMQRLPSEVKPDGTVQPRGFIDDTAVAWKILTREGNAKPFSYSEDVSVAEATPQEPKDLAARLTDSGALLVRLPDIENAKLLNVTIDPMPWADSYWPLYKGMVGIRYADPSFPDSKDWSVNHNYIMSSSALAIFDSGHRAAIDRLSPAEKYDLVMGDRDLTLTSFAWNQGLRQFESAGFVATWMGICHGWAGAAHMQAAYPKHPVVVTASNGQRVTFYPQDVKALQSVLWANANVPTRFVGSRCNIPKPPRNANGRILDPKCFDVDPATWHLATANQMGVHHRSFVMDATYDVEVWNYPIAKYKVHYFNPQSWRESDRMRASAIPLSKYTLDKFPEFRSKKATSVVGVIMDVSHVAAVTPTTANPTSAPPPLKTLRFIYDLELDANGNLVGGEWYTNAHPDFIWTFAPDAQAYAFGETPLKSEAWMASDAVPAHWTEFAKRGSAHGEPLFSFVGRIAGEPLTNPLPNPESPDPAHPGDALP